MWVQKCGTILCLFLGASAILRYIIVWRPHFEVIPPAFQEQRTAQKTSWVAERKAILAEGGPRKLLFLAYMRGGSSIGGEIFNRDPRAVYWYEPLAAFHMAHYGLSYAADPHAVMYGRDRRTKIGYDVQGQDALATFFDDLFQCRYDRLPVASWTHRFVKFSNSPALGPLKECVLLASGNSELDRCPRLPRACSEMEGSRWLHCPEVIAEVSKLVSLVPKENLRKPSTKKALARDLNSFLLEQNFSQTLTTGNKVIIEHEVCVRRLGLELEPCRRHAKTSCREAELHATKVLRLPMSEVTRLLIAMPDLHVVHYVRDPRATAASRTARETNRTKVLEEVEILCGRVEDDTEARERLEDEFPGAFLEVRYEDLVLQPLGTASVIYGFLGMDASQGWTDFAGTVLPMNDSDSSVREKTLRSLTGWASKFSDNEHKAINKLCKKVLKHFGYPSA